MKIFLKAKYKYRITRDAFFDCQNEQVYYHVSFVNFISQLELIKIC